MIDQDRVEIPYLGPHFVTVGGVPQDEFGEPLPLFRYENGEYGLLLEWEASRFRGPIWRLMLSSFYRGNLLGAEPEFVDGNFNNCHLDNIVFMKWHYEQREYVPLRYSQAGFLRQVDSRKLRRVEIIETGEVFDSAIAVARAIGGQRSNISACLHGRLKHHRGYSFRYVY